MNKNALTTNITENSRNDLSEYFERCINNLKIGNNNTAIKFLQRKGIYGTYINNKCSFDIGLDPEFYDEKDKTTWEALIIPTSKHSYFAMSIPDDANEESIYRKIGSNVPFNVSAIYNNNPTYIVEGIFDAISIEIETKNQEKAVALGGTDFSGLLEYLDRNNNKKPDYPLLISLDNDEEGISAANSLHKELNERNIPAFICNISNEFRSPNELYVASASLSFFSKNHSDLKTNIAEQRKNYCSNIDNEKMIDNYLATFSSQGKLENFNRSVACKKFGSVIKWFF